jgi:predicted enzyme related to lactoylglutathione lyase
MTRRRRRLSDRLRMSVMRGCDDSWSAFCRLYYFNVEAVDRATALAKDGGGEVLNGPMQVPGGSWIVQCRDPQGAMFAMMGPKR